MQSLHKLDIHGESFLRLLIRRQFRLSAGFAAGFLVVLFGLPLANYFLPELLATRIFGFTLTWLILGVGFFPAVWVLSWLFIRRSIELEDYVVREVQSGGEVAPARASPAIGNRAEGLGSRDVPQTT
ncbi:MAG TPA: DUF485 domain-containing protein [Clostridia bacterium]|nr:DUF485 domain-containing protein [Clostridia bacterium]